MPLPRSIVSRIWQRLQYLYLCFLLGAFWINGLRPTPAWGLTESQPIHFSGDKQIWDRKANRVELIGHAAVSQYGETLTGDYVILDMNSRVLDAKGNCVYMASDSTIWGEEMHFNLDTRTGTVVGGRVSNDRFTLRGERINKLGAGRFQTHWGTYSTCKDCAESWALQSEDMDMQIDGYAHLSNVTTRIKDAPAFWLPYLIVPMKTHRQTGFLFPKFSFSGVNGTSFVFPFFWDISRSADMTFGLGDYTARGFRFEWEGRYVLSGGVSKGNANFYFIGDNKFSSDFGVSGARWGFDVSQTQELPWNIMGKLRLTEISDNMYPFHFSADLPTFAGDAFLRSYLNFSRSSSDLSAFVSFQRNRGILNSASGNVPSQVVDPDPRVVQAYPSLLVTTNDKFLWGDSLVGGLTFGLTNFTRSLGPFDYDSSSVQFGTAVPSPAPAFNSGYDPIRKAVRLSLFPTVYTTLRPFDVISVVPSVQYKQYFYDFGGLVSPLARGYLLFQTDISTQLEKVFDYPDDPDYPRMKHLIRPLLTYSLIPVRVEDPNHPFVHQIAYAQSRGISGYNFDNNDIVPYTYNQNGALYFVPLGHSLAYGLKTQWIRRKGSFEVDKPTYQNVIELSAGQAINFLEMTNPVDPSSPHVFNRFFTDVNFNYEKFVSQISYSYFPDRPVNPGRHVLTATGTVSIAKTLHQRIYNFDRSLSFSYSYNPVASTSYLSSTLNFSLSDYILPYGSISYNFFSNQLAGIGAGLQLQSPSQCWKMIAGLNYVAVNGFSFAFDLQMNLTGGGFGGFGELANQVVSGLTSK